jgi:hypothetical protein
MKAMAEVLYKIRFINCKLMLKPHKAGSAGACNVDIPQKYTVIMWKRAK